MGSGLPPERSGSSPWPWEDHPVSGPLPQTFPPRADRGGGALFGLGFPAAPPDRGLTRLRERLAGSCYTKHAVIPSTLGTTTLCGRAVSGSLSLPFRGAFHLSLTVLVRYRSPGVFSLGGWSPQLPPGFHVSRGTRVPSRSRPSVPYRTVTVSGPAFQRGSSGGAVDHSVAGLLPRREGPTTPLPQRQQASSRQRFGLFPVRSPLLGESRLISPPRGSEMFPFPRFPPRREAEVPGHDPGWVAPFGDPRITAVPAAPRGLSQPGTSFIGSGRPGIRRAPSLTHAGCVPDSIVKVRPAAGGRRAGPESRVEPRHRREGDGAGIDGAGPTFR